MKQKEHIWKGHEIIPADAGCDFLPIFVFPSMLPSLGVNLRQLSNYGI